MTADRRDFLKYSVAPLYVARKAFGANDRPAYGLIGAGGRGRYISTLAQKLGAECVAIAEVYETNTQRALKDAPQAKTHVDYKDLLAQQGIDFVMVATPDHQHCPNLLDALAAGKDVYLEKPMSHSLAESRKMIEATRKTKRIVQIGMHRRSAPMIYRAKRLVDDGLLGHVSLVKPLWNWNVSRPLNNTPLEGKLDWKRFCGPANIEFAPMKFRSWRYFWAFSGGNMTDQGTHLMDVTQWFTGTGGPMSAICYGQAQKNTGSEVPDVFTSVFEYPQHMVTWTLNYCNSYEDGWSIQFQGDKGTLVLDEAGYRLYTEPWREKVNRVPAHQEEVGVPQEAHVKNFLDCIQSRQEPNCPVEVGAAAVSGPHLANVAFRQRRQVRMAEALKG
jgi:predicted dehydrogenase